MSQHLPRPGPATRVLARLRALLERRLLGVSAEEIRYTFEDVRAELRATRAELKAELVALRAEVDALAGHAPPGAEPEAPARPGRDPVAKA